MMDFSSEAQSAFSFLIEKYNFKCASVAPNIVRYESENIFIEIYYGARDCEVALEFGRLVEEKRLSFDLFLKKVNPSLEKQMGDRIAWDVEAIRKDLRDLASALQLDGLPIIDNDDATFEWMNSVRWWHFQPDVLKKSPKNN